MRKYVWQVLYAIVTLFVAVYPIEPASVSPMDESGAKRKRKMVRGTYAERGGVEEHAGVLALVEERVRNHSAVRGSRAPRRAREAERVAYQP